MKKDAIPILSAEELKQQMWETLLAIKNKKLSADAGRGIAAISEGLLSIVRVEMQSAKQNAELGGSEKPLISARKDTK